MLEVGVGRHEELTVYSMSHYSCSHGICYKSLAEAVGQADNMSGLSVFFFFLFIYSCQADKQVQ